MRGVPKLGRHTRGTIQRGEGGRNSIMRTSHRRVTFCPGRGIRGCRAGKESGFAVGGGQAGLAVMESSMALRDSVVTGLMRAPVKPKEA